jgi:hypothetical protein
VPDPARLIAPAGLRDRRLSPAPLPWLALRWRRVTVSSRRKAADSEAFHRDPAHPMRWSARALGLANRMLGHSP